MVHLVVVIFHGRTQRSERREVSRAALMCTRHTTPRSQAFPVQAQDLVRQQFGKLLRGRPHKLHIVRLLTGGESPTDLSAFIARAITSKAAALESDGAPASSCFKAVRCQSRPAVLHLAQC